MWRNITCYNMTEPKHMFILVADITWKGTNQRQTTAMENDSGYITSVYFVQLCLKLMTICSLNVESQGDYGTKCLAGCTGPTMEQHGRKFGVGLLNNWRGEMQEVVNSSSSIWGRKYWSMNLLRTLRSQVQNSMETKTPTWFFSSTLALVDIVILAGIPWN